MSNVLLFIKRDVTIFTVYLLNTLRIIKKSIQSQELKYFSLF